MMKVQALLLIVSIIIPTLKGYPLEENITSPSRSDSKSSDLKINPLLSGRLQQQKNEDDSKPLSTKDDDDSTEKTYIEETFIEVLLPGTQQLNSSILDSLFNSSTIKGNSSRDEQGATRKFEVPTAQVRPVRDTSNTDNLKDDPSEEKSKTLGTITRTDGSTISPALYSTQRGKDVKAENDCEPSTDEKTNKQKASSGLELTESQSSSNRVVRTDVPALHLQQSGQVRPARENDDSSRSDSSEEESKPIIGSQSSNISSVPYSDYGSQNLETGSNPSRESSSRKESSEEESNKQHVSQSHSSSSRVVRDIVGKDTQSSNKNSHRQLLSESPSSSTVTPSLYSAKYSHVNNNSKISGVSNEASSPKSRISTESIVFVTPQARNLQQPQQPSVKSL